MPTRFSLGYGRTPHPVLRETRRSGRALELTPAVITTLRAPEAPDYTALASWLPDAQACLRWAGPLIPFPIAVESLAQQLFVPGGASYFLAGPGDQVLGFGQHWVRRPGTMHLGRIIIAPDARGQGLGRELCTQLISKGTEATGAGAVTLRVYRDNEVALSLYKSLGFVAVEPESSEEALFMVRTLPSGIPSATTFARPPLKR